MMPYNPVLGSTVLRRPAIQSPNYAAGSAGWAIMADGTCEFNSGTFRGILQLASGESIDFLGSGSGLNAAVYAVKASSSAAAGYLVLAAPTDDADVAFLELAGESQDGSVPPYVHVFGGNAGTETGVHVWLTALSSVPSAPGGSDCSFGAVAGMMASSGGWLGPAAALEPGTSGTAASWHQETALGAGWTATGGADGVWYRMLPDDHAELEFDVSATAAPSGTLCTIPAQWAPAQNLRRTVLGTAGGTFLVNVHSTGQIGVTSPGVAQDMCGRISWPVAAL